MTTATVDSDSKSHKQQNNIVFKQKNYSITALFLIIWILHFHLTLSCDHQTDRSESAAFQFQPPFFDNSNNQETVRHQQNPSPLSPAIPHPESILRNSPEIIMRAWTCHGRNQRELVDRLIQARIIKSYAVQQAMNQVDRRFYVNYDTAEDTVNYQDTPQPIGLGQTISAPHMHAHALEEILPYLVHKKDTTEPIKILDVGCGSGYLTACFGRWFHSEQDPVTTTVRTLQQPSSPEDDHNSDTAASTPATASRTSSKDGILGRPGKVFGIDIHSSLVEMAAANIRKNDSDLLDSRTVQLSVTNGWNGLPAEAPFDAIHVGAAANSFPYTLAQQLKVGGVLIVPIGPIQGSQSLYKVERIASNSGEKYDARDFKLTELLGVRNLWFALKVTDRDSRKDENNLRLSAEEEMHSHFAASAQANENYDDMHG